MSAKNTLGKKLEHFGIIIGFKRKFPMNNISHHLLSTKQHGWKEGKYFHYTLSQHWKA